MDDFLTKLYEEEQTKVAQVELETFLRSMDKDDIEAFLGLDKVAVAGPAEPEMPANWQGSELDAAQKAKDDYLAQEHQGAPKSVEKTDKWAQTCNSQEGESKAKTAKEDEPKTKAAEANLLWADKIGRLLAKEAASCKQSEMGMEKEDEFTNPAAKAKAKAFAATMKASKGKPLATRKSALQKTEAAIEKKGKEKKSMGPGDMGGGGMGGGGAPPPPPAPGMGGMETTASVKAKIAQRAMKVSEGAPEHIKAAALYMAGREMAKEALQEMGQEKNAK